VLIFYLHISENKHDQN